MSAEASRKRASPASRRGGYVASLVVNVFLLVALNLWPGWDILPFLTRQTGHVMVWVNAALLVSVVANLVYLATDPVWLRAAGDIVTTAVGLVVIVRVWQVFPFDLHSDTWRIIAEVMLGVAVFGSVVGIIGAVARLVRAGLRSAT